jgi:hypothetical protein
MMGAMVNRAHPVFAARPAPAAATGATSTKKVTTITT